jgi:hypothetical protein
VAAEVLAAGSSYGTNQALAGERVNLEFISANPTGPLHVGHTRWAALGDALARLLAACGAEVTREFYINDLGVQMDKFGASLMAAVDGRPVPEGGYHGAYVAELAQRIAADHPELAELPDDERLVAFVRRATACSWPSSGSIWRTSGRTSTSGTPSARCMPPTGSSTASRSSVIRDICTPKAGALWMRTTDFGDDKDRVLLRSNGEYTYFASDTAYYVDKRERGFDRCIYMLGADHHGYVGRLRAMAACAGDDPDATIEVLIGQLVKVLRGGAELRLSKRAGTILGLQELVDITGVDALRYTLCRHPADSQMTVDVDEVTGRAATTPCTTCSTRTPGSRRSCATPPTCSIPSTSASPPRPTTRSARLTRARATCSGRSAELPRVGSAGCRAARAAPGRPLPRADRVDVPQVLSTSAGCCPWETRRSPTAPGAAGHGRGDPGGAGQRPGAARASRLLSGCSGVRTHEAGALHGQSGDRPSWLRPPGDVNELAAELWSTTVHKGDELEVGGLTAGALAAAVGTPAYVLDEVDFRGRAAAFRDAFADPELPADVYYAAKAFVCSQVVRWIEDEGLGLDVCTGGELAVALQAGFPAERMTLHGQQQVRR